MKTLLVGVGESPESASVVASAVALARTTRERVSLLHVVDVAAELPPPGSILMELPSSAGELVIAARRRLALLADDVPEALRGDILVQTGDPAAVLCAVARERDVSAVFIGAHRLGIVQRALGSTAIRVLNQIDRPVVVVRGHPVDASDQQRTSEDLRADHARIENVYADLTRAYRRGDWREVQAAWTTFELSLRAHMDFEERHLRHAFARANPVETKALLAEHAELRILLSTLGVAVDLHVVREPQIDELLTRLRAHSAHVEHLFSVWLDADSSTRGAPAERPGVIDINRARH